MARSKTGYSRSFSLAAIAISLVGSGMLLSSCSKLFPSDTIRFRVDLAIPTIHGVVQGSGVLQGKYERTTWPTRNAFSSTLKGEAILIELPNNAAIVATLNGTLAAGKATEGQSVVMLPERLFTDEAIAAEPDWSGKRERIVATIAANEGWTRTITYSEGAAKQIADLPFLVYLKDRNEPRSLRALQGDPVLAGEPQITVTITSDSVTTGLNSRLPWLRTLAATRLPISGKRTSLRTGQEPLQDKIDIGSFSTEILK